MILRMTNFHSEETLMIYGYGIVDKDGIAILGEGCVSETRLPLDDAVQFLNEEPDDFSPYIVVQLTFRCKGGKFS